MPGRAAGDPRGKLKAVATNWARGRGGSKPADDALSRASAAAIEAIERRRGGSIIADAVEIGPDEADVVTLFFSLGSQWRVHPMAGVLLGLDYPSIPATAAMIGVTMTPDLFQDLRVMEGAALSALASR